MVLAAVFLAGFVGLMLSRMPPIEVFSPDFNAGRTPGRGTPQSDIALHTYKVQSGDAWWKVARDHGVSTRALLDRNGADIGTPLVVGQNIMIPDEASPPSSSASSAPATSTAPTATASPTGSAAKARAR